MNQKAERCETDMDQSWNDYIGSIYDGMYQKMCGLSYRVVGGIETTEELAQDVFVLALSNQKKLQDHPNLEGWMMLTFYNLAKNEGRKHSHFDISLEEFYEMPGKSPETPLEDILPPQLTAAERQILIWKFEQQMEYREMAERLGITEAGCRSRVSRAVAKCRYYWKNKDSQGGAQ